MHKYFVTLRNDIVSFFEYAWFILKDIDIVLLALTLIGLSLFSGYMILSFWGGGLFDHCLANPHYLPSVTKQLDNRQPSSRRAQRIS